MFCGAGTRPKRSAFHESFNSLSNRVQVENKWHINFHLLVPWNNLNDIFFNVFPGGVLVVLKKESGLTSDFGVFIANRFHFVINLFVYATSLSPVSIV